MIKIITVIVIAITTWILAASGAFADGSSYKPATSCDFANFTLGTGAATEVGVYDGTVADTRITVENSGGAPVRCTFGNVYGSVPLKPTTSAGFEIGTTSTAFDFYPFVPPTADTWCIAESGSPHVSVLRCHQ